MASPKKLPKYIDVDGFRLPFKFYPPALRDTVNYKPRDDDVFLVTYPKCGTNWMHFIIYLIYSNGEPPKTGAEFFSKCPFPEAFGIESLQHMSRPGVIKTHLPFNMQPYSPESKYIFVARNPKDCCVSFYHHTESSANMYDFEGGDFNDYFELFIDGKVDWGDYFDCVMSWYEHRNDPNVLWLTYEEMKADTAGVILKVARFIGEKHLESDDSLVQKIVENSSVKNMKVVANEFTKDLASQLPAKMTPAMKHIYASQMESGNKESAAFRMVRKGIVGDWRNIMTEDQVRRLDEKTERRMGGTEILKFWKEIGAV